MICGSGHYEEPIAKPAGGLSGSPPEAKLPSSHMSLMSLQRSEYLTATTE